MRVLPDGRRARRGRLPGARGHNLKAVELNLPLGLLVCITGVSGSGKSTLINDTVYAAVARHLYVSESELEGKPTSTKIGALQVWQKQDGGWKLLARQGFKLPDKAA